MHQGQIPGPSNPPDPSFNQQQGTYGRPSGSPLHGKVDGNNGSPALPQPIGNINVPNSLSANANSLSLDDLLSGAAKDADRDDIIASTKAEPKIDGPHEEKKGRKDKDKNTKLVYSDNDISPEEKMAQLPRYAFAPSGINNSVIDGATTTAFVATGSEIA